MKRQQLIQHIEQHNCKLLREVGKHNIFYNPANMQTSAIPRHREINDFLAKKNPKGSWCTPNLKRGV